MTLKEAETLNPGDIVACNTRGMYCITDFGVQCYFKRMANEGFIVVEVASGAYKGAQFEVLITVFDVIGYKDAFDKQKDISESELIGLLF